MPPFLGHGVGLGLLAPTLSRHMRQRGGVDDVADLAGGRSPTTLRGAQYRNESGQGQERARRIVDPEGVSHESAEQQRVDDDDGGIAHQVGGLPCHANRGQRLAHAARRRHAAGQPQQRHIHEAGVILCNDDERNDVPACCDGHDGEDRSCAGHDGSEGDELPQELQRSSHLRQIAGDHVAWDHQQRARDHREHRHLLELHAGAIWQQVEGRVEELAADVHDEVPGEGQQERGEAHAPEASVAERQADGLHKQCPDGGPVDRCGRARCGLRGRRDARRRGQRAAWRRRGAGLGDGGAHGEDADEVQHAQHDLYYEGSQLVGREDAEHDDQ
mmetsp:Transcript_57372/g.147528  ORF Transcript_57372/g.147528 Transcript_57372/m.147528 type:complete len:330 (+) Transcript_57372:1055-2044(+)